MEFSESFKCTKHLCSYSNDGKYLAILNQLKLIIRSADNFKCLKSFVCDGEIDYIEWSPDSQFVICAAYSPRAFVQVFSLENSSWRCKITEGNAGIVKAIWSPDSRHVLTIGMFHLQLSIWSLVKENVSQVHYLKEGNPAMAFSSDGTYLALLEQRNFKDYILILPCSSWAPFMRLECSGITSAAGLLWCPRDDGICAWGGSPEEGLSVFWLEGGSKVVLPTSKKHTTMAVKSAVWSPTGQFLAIGTTNGQVLLINTVTWRPIATFNHQHSVENASCTVYFESPKTAKSKLKYVVADGRPVKVTQLKDDSSKVACPLGSNAKHFHGIRRLMFCPSGAWLASLDDSCPYVLWIWSVSSLDLEAVLVQNQNVTDFAWSPCGNGSLALCSSGHSASFWTPRGGALITGTSNKVCRVRWHPTRESLLLLGSGESLVCQFIPDDNYTREWDKKGT